MLVGVKILIIIALMGGLIAYMGDKLGTKLVNVVCPSLDYDLSTHLL